MYTYRDKRFINPSFWGRAFWNYMFMYSKYAHLHKRTPLQHFKTLSFFIAGSKCRRGFRKKLKDDPPPAGKDGLFKWIWRLKNEVNKRQRTHLKLNKNDITLKQAKKEQSRLSDPVTLSVFLEKLALSMPTLHPLVRERRRYHVNYVMKNLEILLRDINYFVLQKNEL